jgi:hypothetical protein
MHELNETSSSGQRPRVYPICGYTLDRGHGLQAPCRESGSDCGFPAAFAGLQIDIRYIIVVAVAVVMWESPQGFPRGVGRVESRLYGFPYPGISMASFLGGS